MPESETKVASGWTRPLAAALPTARARRAAQRLRTLCGRIASTIARVGASPLESGDEALRRTLLVASSLACSGAGLLWGLSYWLAGAPAAAAIPLAYAAVSLLSTGLFAVTRRYPRYRTAQLGLILILPWAMSVALGGIQPSSAVIIWSVLCPFGALILTDRRTATGWFLAFLLAVASGILIEIPAIAGPLAPGVVHLFLGLNIGALFALLFAMMAHFIDRVLLFQERSELLLHSILPKGIAEALKGDPHSIADHYEQASILFADVVDFTGLSSGMEPGELVAILDEVFQGFDQLVEEAGLEKIKTIGDCYMVAAGVPQRREDHAQALARLALAMNRLVAERRFRGRHLRFRIGLNSGPVVAGVIGRRKFIYDLWGDAVNMASRMESQGMAGMIQFPRATYDLLRQDFVCRPAGRLEIKGKGEVAVYHLLGERTPP